MHDSQLPFVACMLLWSDLACFANSFLLTLQQEAVRSFAAVCAWYMSCIARAGRLFVSAEG